MGFSDQLVQLSHFTEEGTQALELAQYFVQRAHTEVCYRPGSATQLQRGTFSPHFLISTSRNLKNFFSCPDFKLDFPNLSLTVQVTRKSPNRRVPRVGS